MDDGLIQQIVNFVKEAAPVMWQAAYKQTYVVALEYLLMFLGIAALVAYTTKWYFYFVRRIKEIDESDGRHGWSSGTRDDYEMGRFAFATMVIVLIGLDVLILNVIIARIINPDYYAIQNLINLIPIIGD